MLAIAGGKGGTGKTTTAVALARAFAARRRVESVDGAAAGARGSVSEVVLADADVDMPDVHSMVGVPRSPTVVDRPRGIAVPSLPGVRVAPAPSGGRSGELLDALRSLRVDRAERVLVDTPCGAGPDACRPLAVADGVVLVTRPTPQAVRDTVKTAAIARRLGTTIRAVAVVSERYRRGGSTGGVDGPIDGLRAVFGVDPVVVVPRVAGDPLDDEQVSGAVERLVGPGWGANTFLGGDE